MNEFEQTLIRTIENSHPETLEKAVELARLSSSTSSLEKRIVDSVLRLESQGKISLEKPIPSVPSSLVSFLLSGRALWFWAVFALALATTVTIFLIPENAIPLVYVRYAFGGFFVLFLPGHSLIRALFGSKELDNVERLALSISLSSILIPLAGLVLNYTPWGMRTTPITLSLLALTLVIACGAVARDLAHESNVSHSAPEK